MKGREREGERERERDREIERERHFDNARALSRTLVMTNRDMKYAADPALMAMARPARESMHMHEGQGRK